MSFRARDGLLIHGYLTLPALPKAQRRKLPLIVYPHGGPYARDDWGYDEKVQFFANRGYAVLQINYRGSTGYGKKFLQAAFRERGGKMSSDLVDGKRWVVEQGYADPKRTCMYGVSYGAYAVLVALAFTPDEFVCGVEAYGASNLITLLKSFPPHLGALPTAVGASRRHGRGARISQVTLSYIQSAGDQVAITDRTRGKRPARGQG